MGEEAANVGAVAAINIGSDLITSNHRGHGQSIAWGLIQRNDGWDYGESDGTCKGKGGSMHIADLDGGNLGANGIVGGGMGMA